MSAGPAGPETADAVTAVWRRESARLVGALARLTRDLDVAEDLAQDALVAALEAWPRDGVPLNPGAWLMQVARRRAVDLFRRNAALRAKTTLLAHDLEEADVPDLAAAVDHVEDDVLRLMLLTCHPALSSDSRVALTLRLVCGLSTTEIARALVSKESAVAQRISRAKRTLAETGVALELPAGSERRERLDDVLAVVYLVFNEGYTATSGRDWTRPDLCHEGVRLARIIAGLAPDEPETHGLQALLELQASRLPARQDADGVPVLLEEQDRARWDHLLRRRGLRALERAMSEAARRGAPIGVYTVQAQIAAVHARAARADDTDWTALARWYDALAAAAPGAVVELNRAVAHGRAHGAFAGLAVLEAVEGSPALAGSHLAASVRGDLLERAGRRAEAVAAFEAAASRTRNDAERALLVRRAAANRSASDVEDDAARSS